MHVVLNTEIIINLKRSLKDIVNNFILIMFFCLETKEPKVQDLELSAKNKICSLKILKLARFQDLFLILNLSRAQTVEFS
ncbi:hypothetical protein GCM10023210_02660 [Chryseobacterium ginsengisoli]|uniref:Uncharacterized protein n=1 Tax=Chryseobacterium ginsengisoli TaxID=363853 RepID=A0ABP9LV56_9FLAO